MKQIILLVAVLVLGACSTMNQQEKAAAKATEDARQLVLFNQAVEALNAKDFILEADRVEFKRGNFRYVQPNTNFIEVKGDRATVQLALSNFSSGPNGIGGITVQGVTSGVEMKTDSKGNISYSMMVQGTGISAQVIFSMVKGTNQCTATVTPNFSSNRISFTGYLYPTEESNVFKGRVL